MMIACMQIMYICDLSMQITCMQGDQCPTYMTKSTCPPSRTCGTTIYMNQIKIVEMRQVQIISTLYPLFTNPRYIG